MVEAAIAYAPNISWLFPELPFRARPNAVREAGFEAVEFGFPAQADLPSLQRAREEFGMRVVLFNQDLRRWDAGHRGLMADPALASEFRRSLDATLELAHYLSALKVMLPVGAVNHGIPRQAQLACIVDNLRLAAPIAADAHVLLTIETLNPHDYPGYLLGLSQEGFNIVRQVDHPNLRFQFDTYHLQTMEGHIAETLSANIDLIGHIQFGDCPGRVQPGFGTLDFAHLDTLIAQVGYSGYIGLEYFPALPGSRALDWVPRLRRRMPSSYSIHL